jgi:hypothetical protein
MKGASFAYKTHKQCKQRKKLDTIHEIMEEDKGGKDKNGGKRLLERVRNKTNEKSRKV